MASPESGTGTHPPTEVQGELSIDVPQERKRLSEQEFAGLANRTFREFGTTIVNTFYQTIRDGLGKEILGTVSERGAETEIALESSSEHMFINICNKNTLPVIIIGEHQTYKIPESNGVERRHIALFDALDDTREYEQGGQGHQGLPAPLWAVGSIFSLEGQPITGIIVNLKEKKMYISANGKNSLVDLETAKEEELKPSERTSIKDKDFCLATYLGDPAYALSFFENFSGVVEALKNANNNAVIQPHTGSFIYGPMAEGNVDAYLMTKEPISEQLPGWVFAQAAGFTAWEINSEDGSYKEIKHDLNRFKDDPTEYRKGRMSIYLVTRSNQVRDEIISLIMKDRIEKKEFEIFRASR